MHASSIPAIAGSHLHYRWQLTGLALAMLLPSLGTSIANIALPTLTEAFGATFQDVQWVVLAYLLAMTTTVVSAGRLGDLFGRQRLLVAGIVIFALASVACALATELWMLVVARAAQGLGAAVMMALSTALASDIVPKDRIGRAMGLLGTMSAVGTALGPSVGGLLIASFGWRAIFAALVPFGAAALIVFILTLRGVATTTSANRRPFDVIGTALLAGGLATYALSMTIGRGTFDAINAGLLVAAAAMFCLFAYAQTRTKWPLIQPAALGDRSLRSGLLSTALVSTVMMTTLVVGPFYLSGAQHLSPVMVGLVLSVGPVLAALAGIPSGQLVDRFGARGIMMVGLVAVAAGCLAVGMWAGAFGVVGYMLSVATTTTGYALFQAANNASIMGRALADQRGVTSGLMSLSRNLGLITGAAAMGAVFILASGGNHASAAATGTTFLVAAGLAIIAIVVTLTGGDRDGPSPSQPDGVMR